MRRSSSGSRTSSQARSTSRSSAGSTSPGCGSGRARSCRAATATTGSGSQRFGPEQEGAYRALRDRLPSHFVRDSAYLNWRYADSPRAYTLLASPSGYAVVGRKQFRGVDTAYVADLVAPTFRETRRLLRRCVRAARGARALLALLPAVHASAYVSAGFVPTPETIRLIGHALDPGALPLGPKAWHFTLGDTDYF